MLEQKKNKLIKVYVIAVIILLIFLYYLGVLVKAEDYFLDILSNFQNRSYGFITKLKYSFVNYQEAQNLKKENNGLKHQLDDLLYENSQLNTYKLENEKLRTILEFLEGKEFDYLLVKVIGRDLLKKNTLIINKGKRDGLNVGYAAVVDNGVIMGKVIEVKDNVATILLLTDNQSQLSISTISTNKTTGLVKGEFGLSINVELIPQDIEIKEGDLIITSGQEQDIPRGLVVGKINRLTSYENDLFKSATINPTIDYEEITILSIIIPKDNTND